ncbi:DUF4255 domain-containing protein [Fluviicola sp.]|uniref:DUF4255 domain-containing protein n=1 Tax=Fluviicola sp. TaxID=1917219 RepID=UPI00260B7022|nr:DUF4255 domain-containing protein [Fluviicola sp.]
MIYEALYILIGELNSYLASQGLDEDVVLDNIAFVENESESTPPMANKVVLTLLNLNEEVTMRNLPNNRIESNKIAYRNNKINLNLYILFSSNKTGYDVSLKYLSRILEFFQGKSVFTQANTNFEHSDPILGAMGDFRYTLELYTPTFENLNYIWGTLGGRQLPSALYKMSLVVIDREATLNESPKITENIGNISVNPV